MLPLSSIIRYINNEIHWNTLKYNEYIEMKFVWQYIIVNHIQLWSLLTTIWFFIHVKFLYTVLMYFMLSRRQMWYIHAIVCTEFENGLNIAYKRGSWLQNYYSNRDSLPVFTGVRQCFSAIPVKKHQITTKS